jgi:TIR domain
MTSSSSGRFVARRQAITPSLFISYRRHDSAGYSGRLHDRLQREFGHNLLFMDVNSIPLGTNFIKVLGEEIAKCDALLAVIGPGWLDARDENGHRRLGNPDDFVRIEIGTALKRGIRVIPILLEGTQVPKADQLPDDLKELALRTGLDVRHASFNEDMERLIRELKGALVMVSRTKKSKSRTRNVLSLASLGLAVTIVTVGLAWLKKDSFTVAAPSLTFIATYVAESAGPAWRTIEPLVMAIPPSRGGRVVRPIVRTLRYVN